MIYVSYAGIIGKSVAFTADSVIHRATGDSWSPFEQCDFMEAPKLHKTRVFET